MTEQEQYLKDENIKLQVKIADMTRHILRISYEHAKMREKLAQIEANDIQKKILEMQNKKEGTTQEPQNKTE